MFAAMALVGSQDETLECIERTRRQSSEAREGGHVMSIIDAAMVQIALERVVVRALSSRCDFDAREHRSAHASMRLALFRLATAPAESPVFVDALRLLERTFGERTASLLWAMLHRLDPDQLSRVSDAVAELFESLEPPSSKPPAA